MALTIFEDTFGKSKVRIGKIRRSDPVAEYLTDVTSAVQSVVDTFRNPNDGKRYVVALSDRVEAFTKPGEQRIVVSHQPLFDKGLKVSVACTIMTGLVLHEIGHTIYTIPNTEVIKRKFGDPSLYKGWGEKPFDQLAHTLLNIGDDARLEARLSALYPIAKDIFPTTLHWLALRVGMVGRHNRWTGSAMPMSERVNFAGTAIRYPWTATWSSDEVTRAERIFWADWKARYISLDDADMDGLVVLVREGLSRLRNPNEPDADEPEPEPGDEPGDEPDEPTPGDDFDDDDEEEDDESDDPDADDEDDDEEEDADDDEQDPDEDDEPDDEPPVDGPVCRPEGPTGPKSPKGGDESGDDDGDDLDEGDDDEDGEDHGAGDGDEDGDEPDDDEPDPEGEGKKPRGDIADPEGEDKAKGETPDGHVELGDESDEGDEEEDEDPTSFKQDFDAHDLRANLDALNRDNDGDYFRRREGELTQTLLNEERVIDRVKSSEWGTAKAVVIDPMQRLARVTKYGR